MKIFIAIIVVLSILFIRECVLEYRYRRYKALHKHKAPQKRVVIQKRETSTGGWSQPAADTDRASDDWWDQPADDSGWTNGDYICASEIFDEW